MERDGCTAGCEERIASLEVVIEALEDGDGTLRARITELEDEIEECDERIDELEDDLREAENDAEELQTKLDDAPDMAPADLAALRERVEWEKTQRALGKPVSLDVLFDALDTLLAAWDS